MAKKIFFLSAFLSYGFFCRAQFFALEYDSVNPYVTVLPYPMDSYYRVVSFDHRFPAMPVNRTRIKVYDSLQQYVKTINLLKGITLVNDYPPLLFNKRLLWPANYNDTVSLTKHSLVILELDTTYNFVALHTVSTHTNRAMPTGLVAYSTGFVVGEYFNGPTVSSTGFSTKMFKLNLNLQKKDSALFLDELRLKTHISNNNNIVGASDDISSACTSTIQGTQKIVLDTNLTIIDCYNTPVSLIMCYDAGGNMTTRYPIYYKKKGIIFPLSNKRNYIHGEADNYNCVPLVKHKAIFSGGFINNLQTWGYINTNYPDDTEFSLYQAADCDYHGSKTIYVGTVGLKNNFAVDKNFYLPYYARLKTQMTVTKLDTLSNLVWRFQYGGEMNYFARSVAFTADGGCVVGGSRYDSATFFPNKVFQNFLMKLDSSGNVVNVGLKDNPGASTKKINCFPNPASKNIYFDTPFGENCIIQIYNITGQLILQRKCEVNPMSIEVQELKTGMYLYKIITTKQVYPGKFLKE